MSVCPGSDGVQAIRRNIACYARGVEWDAGFNNRVLASLDISGVFLCEEFVRTAPLN
jgi:hypothetical protein